MAQTMIFSISQQTMMTVKSLSLQMASMDIKETQDLQEFLARLNQNNKFEYVVFDMDSLDFNQFKRVYQLIYRHQVPCLIIGESFLSRASLKRLMMK